MQHIAVDLGSVKSHICVRESSGAILLEQQVQTRSLGRFLKLQPKSRVILETCAEAFRIADVAREHNHEVRVVPSTLARTLGIGSRGVKTDRRDAQVLSEVSTRINLPSVHVPTEQARERRRMSTAREQLVHSKTALVSSVRGWARTQLLRIPSGTTNTFPARVREAAKKTADGLPQYIERMLVAIDCITEQVRAADKELQALAQEDVICQRLMSVPSIGPVTSIRFVAALDDVTRFPNAHMVQAFLGLTPGENSSSRRQQRTGITKAGPPAVRAALIQCAWTLRRHRPSDPISLWAAEIEKRRGKLVATVAVARKLAGVMYALWRDGTTYEPRHSERKHRS